MAKRGRPTSYKEEYNEQVVKLCLLGATDKDLADFFGVCEKTLNNWKLKSPEFVQALKDGRDKADANVGKRLYERAMGYTNKNAVKIFNNGGEPLIVPYEEHYAPDVTACIFWLKNRQKAKWRDKIEQEVSGPNGDPVSFKMVF